MKYIFFLIFPSLALAAFNTNFSLHTAVTVETKVHFAYSISRP